MLTRLGAMSPTQRTRETHSECEGVNGTIGNTNFERACLPRVEARRRSLISAEIFQTQGRRSFEVRLYGLKLWEYFHMFHRAAAVIEKKSIRETEDNTGSLYPVRDGMFMKGALNFVIRKRNHSSSVLY